MKKSIVLIMSVFLAVSLLTGCDIIGLNTTEDKDVSELLGLLGQDLATITELGELPEPEVKGTLYYYNNSESKGYFRGFHLGLELDETMKVSRIYIQPYGEHRISAEGLTIGEEISTADLLFGAGIYSPDEDSEGFYRYIVYATEAYDIKCTLEGETIKALSFTQPGMQKVFQEPEYRISSILTQNAIAELLGQDFELETSEDGGYFDYYTIMTYDGINFEYAHNRYPFSDINVADGVNITSPRFALAALDAQVGDLAKPVLKLCDQSFDPAYDHHNDKEIYGSYLYFEEGKNTPGGRTTWILSFEFDQQIELTDYESIPNNLHITGIRLWTVMD
jgi:hypothetical protein